MTATVLAARFAALGTTAHVLVAGAAWNAGRTSGASDEAALMTAVAAVDAEVAAFDLACSRFRDDSELMGLRKTAGRAVEVSPLLFEALETAVRAAEVTGGLVDPTIGSALRSLGYDRDFSFVPSNGSGLRVTVSPAPGWRTIRLDRTSSTVEVPRGVDLDLGATAKALCADLAARRARVATNRSVLVSLGGDVAVAGPPPPDGWAVQVSDDHAAPLDADAPTVAIFSGGLATSGTAVRRWARGERQLHHLIDPRTGTPADEAWRTVTVAAGSCVDANIASTASIILGELAPAWLDEQGLPARLVRPDGTVVRVGAWPEERR